MKFNWGHGLAVSIIAFIGFIVIMAINMGNTKIELESKDYYERGIHHDEQQEMERNTSELANKPIVQIDHKEFKVKLLFPAEINGSMVKGKVQLYRPSDSDMDKEIEINLEKNAQIIANEKLEDGIWDINVYWEYLGKKYFFEKRIML